MDKFEVNTIVQATDGPHKGRAGKVVKAPANPTDPKAKAGVLFDARLVDGQEEGEKTADVPVGALMLLKA